MSESRWCVVFDFDGVLVDSNRLKRQAYFNAFDDVPLDAAVIAGCLHRHESGDRWDVIGCIIDALQVDWSRRADELSCRVDAYGRWCDSLIAVCPETPGASATLETLASTHVLYVNSATPEDALVRYIRQRGWTSYFEKVLGRPRSKVENLSAIRDSEGRHSRVAFVGDRQSDLAAARAADCTFVGMRSDENDFIERVTLLERLDELPGVLEELRA
jgi:phosphoglycolate phosphatase-like HAD superfamily hydrolase